MHGTTVTAQRYRKDVSGTADAPALYTLLELVVSAVRCAASSRPSNVLASSCRRYRSDGAGDGWLWLRDVSELQRAC